MTKRIVSIVFATCLFLFTSAQNLTPSDADSKVSFTIKNMGLDVDGTFSGLAGKMIFNPKNLKSSQFDVTVNVSSVNTGIKKRDDHLQKADFFDATKFPTISIKTTSIQAKGNNIYFAKAVLTIHGISKNIQFDFIATPIGRGYNFKAGFTINRRDFKVGSYSMVMGDDVKVKLDVTGK